MRGRSTFTGDEASLIRKLLAEKIRASREGQMPIRARLRRMGFYIRNYFNESHPFEVKDFEDLVRNGSIKILD